MQMQKVFHRQHVIRWAALGLLTLMAFLSLSVIQAQTTPAQCPSGQGYWSSHSDWPVTDLNLGSQTYNQADLLILLNTPVSGDASLIIANQLIPAKLNVAAGADASVISGVITQADALLSAYADRLPYAIDPASADGQTLVNLANILESYNNGLLTVGCMVTPTPPPVEETPEATPESTPEATDEPDDDLQITIIIEGPVQSVNINIITIYNINIEVEPDDPILTVIQVGDVIRVEGNVAQRGDTIVIVVINLIFINVDVVVLDGEVWRDDGNCGNPPPPWAPANGWRRRCEGGGGGGGNGSSGSKGNK
ncbi:MAG: hypothetical protein K8I60_21750 [Anaerolineae bacterium]|nr:hypothetical protein [Anaerolineae bacterium]